MGKKTRPKPPRSEDRTLFTKSAAESPSVLQWKDVALLAALFFSGVAALGLELVWIRVLGLAFGSETFGMLGVLVGFFAGLALGAALFHSRVLRSGRPALIYIAAEIAIAGYAFCGPMLILPLAQALPQWLGPAVGDNRSPGALALNLVIAAALLLPASMCMGATTIAAVEAWRRRRTRFQNASTVAWMYAINTLGATIGVVVSIYSLLPALGIARTSVVLGGFNIAAAALAWSWQRAEAGTPAWRRNEQATTTKRSRAVAYTLLFFTGLAGIGLETVGTHVLAQIFEDTVHTFANILAVYLLGTAAGAWIYARYAAPHAAAQRVRATSLLLYGLGVSGVVAAAVLAHTSSLMTLLAPAGCTYVRRMTAETLTSVLVFAPPTLLMGATFSHLVGEFAEEGVGIATAYNTLGGALAPLVFGLLLIPAAGYGAAFYAATALYFALFAAVGLASWPAPRWLVAGLAIGVVTAWTTYSTLVLVHFSPTSRLLDQRISLQGVVSVSEERANVALGDVAPRTLRIDQKFSMGGSPGFVTKRMGALPILVADEPRTALYLGVGTGITAGAALDFPVQRVTAVELVPQILDLLPWFADHNHDLQHDPRVMLYASDARRFVKATTENYDVIVADLYHPSRDGTGTLYTREHFANVRARLREGGLFVQWLPLYQLRSEDLQTIVRTFLAVFPSANSMIGNYSGNARLALIGAKVGASDSNTGPRVDVARVRALLGTAHSAAVFDGVRDLLASYMLDAAALRRYAGNGPINTDLNQRITFDAAGAVDSMTDADTHRSLASLLRYRMPFPDTFVATTNAGERAALRRDVGPYGEAVSNYLAAEVERFAALPGPTPAAAVDEYMRAYEADPRFTLAVGKVLESAIQDPQAAKDLVLRLWRAHPDQPNVALLRSHLAGADSPEAVREVILRFLATGGD